jgi:hypothetical protein
MFDYLRCEMPMPDGRSVSEVEFQTKSIWCSTDRFTISVAGRLIYHRRRYEMSAAADAKPTLGRLVPVANLDMDYHGDLAISGSSADGVALRLAVRFTHGTVEWIRPFDALPEIHRLWLVERGQ